MRNMDIILKHILNNVFFYELKVIKPPRLYSWWFYITYKELISSSVICNSGNGITSDITPSE